MVEGEDRTGAPLPADDDGDCDLAIYWTYLSDNIYIYMYIYVSKFTSVAFYKENSICKEHVAVHLEHNKSR